MRAAWLVAVWILTSCTAHVGHAPPAQRALLVADRSLAHSVYLESVDAQPLGWLHDRVTVPAGEHEITATLRVLVQGREARDTRTLRFEALPGRHYQVSGGWGEFGAHLWIEDAESGRTVVHVHPRAPRLPPVASGSRGR